MLKVEGVRKSFGGLKAVKDVSFEIGKNQIVGLIGPNGAGKTTLFNMISRFLKLNSGQIIFDGHNITNLKPHQICQLGVGRTFQIAKPFMNLTVFDTTIIGALNRSRTLGEASRKSENILNMVGLSHKKNDLGRSLTVGERKRLELSRALATEPKLLLLDEVVAGLNPTEVNEMIGIIKKIALSGISVLLIEHVLQAVMSVSEKVLVLNYGEKIAEGSPADLVKDPKVIDAYLGEEYTIVKTG